MLSNSGGGIGCPPLIMVEGVDNGGGGDGGGC